MRELGRRTHIQDNYPFFLACFVELLESQFLHGRGRLGGGGSLGLFVIGGKNDGVRGGSDEQRAGKFAENEVHWEPPRSHYTDLSWFARLAARPHAIGRTRAAKISIPGAAV